MHSASLDQKIVATIREVIGDDFYALHEPRFVGNERRYVMDCIDSTFVSSVGTYVDRFENALADYTGAKRVVATVNGTAALQVALKLAGVQAGDEVIMPALTFIATANAISYLGATPHFVDSEERTLGVDPIALRSWLEHICEPSIGGYRNRITGRRIIGLVPMHTFGHPCDLEGLLGVSRDYRLVMVEDAAESLGSLYQGGHSGTFGLLGVLSFNGNKIITTGGGGAILTDDVKLADYAKHLTTTAKRSHQWEYSHDEIGYNYRMPNINAALGCAQLEELPKFLSSKRELALSYQRALSGLKGVQLMLEPENCESNYWLQTLILDEGMASQRDKILKTTNEAGIMTRPAWTLMHKLTPYKNCPRSPLPIAESLSRRVINLPSSAGLA